MGRGTKITTQSRFVIATWQKKKTPQKKVDEHHLEQQPPPMLHAALPSSPSLFYTVIKGYSELLKMPSTLIEKEIEHISTEAFTAVIITACCPEQGALIDKDEF